MPEAMEAEFRIHPGVVTLDTNTESNWHNFRVQELTSAFVCELIVSVFAMNV